jgi:hypothetical protein
LSSNIFMNFAFSVGGRVIFSFSSSSQA